METNYDNSMEQSNSNSIARIRNSNSKKLIKKKFLLVQCQWVPKLPGILLVPKPMI